jgi:hypothetical protein
VKVYDGGRVDVENRIKEEKNTFHWDKASRYRFGVNQADSRRRHWPTT